MLSRCWTTSRHLPFNRSIQSIDLRVRNYHVTFSASSYQFGRIHEKKIASNRTAFNQITPKGILFPGTIGFQRNFSATSAVRSATATKLVENVGSLTDLPSVPNVPTAPVQEVLSAVAANGEPTFASLGLGEGYWPTALLQNALEYLHISCDLPWWGAIAVTTVIIRILLTPIVIISQRNAAVMRNMMPEMQKIQLKISEARAMGNPLELAQNNQELMMLMKEKGLNPIKNMALPLAQAPIFLSFFIGIRRMVNTPVESLHTGGILWFQDLTLADPYYLLPLITCGTLALTIRLGTDGARMAQSSELTTYILNAIPIVIFPFIMNFPTALVVYWASSNLCSLAQGLMFKIPSVRKFFKIPILLKHDPEKLPMKQKGFVKNVKNAWSNMKLSREMEDRRQLDKINFERAGTGPVARTYKFDPTKIKKQAAQKSS